jgi:hypothetical protein
VVQGLRLAVRSHVLQSGADTLDKLLKAARVAEVAVVPATTTETVLNQLPAAVQESREVAQQNQAELRRVTRRVEGLTVAQVSDSQTWSASTSTTTERTGQPASRPYRGRGGRRGGRPGWYGMERPSYQRTTSWGQQQQQQTYPQAHGQYTPAPRPQGRVNTLCSRCGRNHGEQTCCALGASCRGCGKRIHFQRCCLNAQRAPQSSTNQPFSN